MTDQQIKTIQSAAIAELKREEHAIMLDINAHKSQHSTSNDRAVIQSKPEHVKIYFFSANSTARRRSGDTLTLYRATYSGVTHKATYTYKEVQPGNPAYKWHRELLPAHLDSQQARSWRAMRWPDWISDKNLETLSRGWRLTGGFAITPTLAKNHAILSATKRWEALQDQITELEQHLHHHHQALTKEARA